MSRNSSHRCALRRHAQRTQGPYCAIDRYRADPDTDFHAFAAQLTGLERPHAKNVNFAQDLWRWPARVCSDDRQAGGRGQGDLCDYDRELPFLRALSQLYQAIHRQGYICYDDARGTSINGHPAAPGGRVPDHVEHTEAEHQARRSKSYVVWERAAWRADTRNALMR